MVGQDVGVRRLAFRMVLMTDDMLSTGDRPAL
jgi:hypothetical protein